MKEQYCDIEQVFPSFNTFIDRERRNRFEAAKMKKQMEFANRRAIPYVAIIGSNELEQGVVTLKNMVSGEQQTVSTDSLVEIL